MVEFVYARACRQETLLRYFGEKEPERCGNCDICSDHARYGRRAGTEEEVLTVRKALSGVARMSHRTAEGWQGRFGKGKIVLALLGSRTREVLDARLDQLSTYGLLHDSGVSYLNELFRELQSAGLIVQNRCVGYGGKEYQTLSLSTLGEQAMRGQTAFELSWPQASGLPVEPPGRSRNRRGDAKLTLADNDDTPSPDDVDLLRALKAKRDEIARRLGNVPRYQIFSDQTLVCFARLKPSTREAGRRIRGVGDVKAELYLPQFLEVIQEHETTGA